MGTGMHSVGNGTHNANSGRVVWIFEIRDQLGASKTARLASTPSKATKYAPCGTLKEKPYRDALRMEIAAAEKFKNLRAIARAHLGGNATGFMTTEYTVGGKWLDLLKDIAPGLTRSWRCFGIPTQGSGTSQFAIIRQGRHRSGWR